ncbi:cysteine desulfurase [Patescibacteria group bacterium]|nr:cysteine desulfurase [Patescibacteria group bacterium]MBU1868330.1 cysteine desulfurase [Patescibacteria group bacterium]
MLDVREIRQDFPILKQKIHGKPLVYFDNAATSQKPQVVIDTISEYYQVYNANIHRGIHYLAEQATEAYENARQKVADFINADKSEIIFTRNATEAINLVALSWGRDNIKPGDTIVLTELEHHANIIPWLMLSKEIGCQINYVRIDEEGKLDLVHLNELLKKNPKLLALTHVSNVMGTITPLPRIVQLAQEKGVPVLVDTAQAVSHLGFNVQKIKVDFLAFTGHKMLGPTGIGVLWAKKEILENMRPLLGGGEMINEVSWDEYTLNKIPWRFEAGTPNIAGVVGLGRAVDYLNDVGLYTIREYEKELTDYAMQMLLEVEGISILGPKLAEERGALAAFTLDGIHPHDLATVLDAEGVAIRSGHHCAMPLHQKLGIPASARASFCFYNTKDEVSVMIKGIRKAIGILGK